MSIVKTEQIICTQCNHPSDYLLWSSINVNDDSHIYNEIIEQKLFEWVCPNCGEHFHIYYPCLYNDVENKFMVYFLPDGYEGVQEELNEFKVSTLFTSYTMRLCSDFFSFREKIKVLTSKINDKGIEIIKLVLLQKFINEDENSVVNIYFHEEHEDQFIFIIVGKDDSVETISVVKEAYVDIIENTHNIDFNIEEGEFLNIDIQWAIEQLKSA